jgi:hypothetical protein
MKTKGRPTNRAKAIETVLERLSAGEPLQKICLDESLPSRATILRWRREDPTFARQYLHARKDAAVYHMDEAIKLISGNLPTFRDKGDIERGDPAAVQFLKLQVETRIKTAAVLSPEFSAKHSLEMTGKDGMPLLPPSDPVEIARNVAFALAAGMQSLDIGKPAPEPVPQPQKPILQVEKLPEPEQQPNAFVEAKRVMLDGRQVSVLSYPDGTYRGVGTGDSTPKTLEEIANDEYPDEQTRKIDSQIRQQGNKYFTSYGGRSITERRNGH